MANCLTVSSAGVTRGNGFGLEKIKRTFFCFSSEILLKLTTDLQNEQQGKHRPKDVKILLLGGSDC